METYVLTLEDCYYNFTSGSKDMDGRQFAKLCKDCGFLDKKFTTTDADLLFTSIKAQSERKITFSEFNLAIATLASKKGTSKEALFKAIKDTGGPKFQRTNSLVKD